MRVLITGGTGFIGSRLAIRCLERGHEVTILGQENSAAEVQNRQLAEAKGAKAILASVMDEKKVFQALQGVDWIYHLAATQHEANVPDQRFWDVNVDGTRKVLEASIRAGVKRFIHGSTIGVYGSLEGQIDEESSLQPDNIYGVTKLEGEKLVLSFQKKIPVIIIRISETYGPGDYRLLKLFSAIQKGIFLVVGNGRNRHHLIYIDDLVEGMLLAATVEKAVGQILVFSGKEAPTTDEMTAVIARQLGKSIPRFHLPLVPFLALATILEAVLRPLGIQPPLHRRRMDFFKKSFVFSQERSGKVLGFIPKIGFEQGVTETARWYREMGYL